MKAEKFNIGKLIISGEIISTCDKVAYILYPMDVLDNWIEDASGKYGVSIVVVTGMDWDDDLTPWRAPGEPKGCPAFKGDAHEFLKTLINEVVPQIEQRYGMCSNISRSLIGVSLSGLFTLWQWPGCDMFLNIATLSGSFWYEGFEQWVLSKTFSKKKGLCYMLLGAEEPNSPTPAFRKVGICTEHIVGYLKQQGVDITYDIVPGNHFQFGLQRLDKAFAHLFD